MSNMIEVKHIKLIDAFVMVKNLEGLEVHELLKWKKDPFTNYGKVVSIADNSVFKKSKEVEIGDVVVFGKHTGEAVFLDDGEYTILYSDDVLAKYEGVINE